MTWNIYAKYVRSIWYAYVSLLEMYIWLAASNPFQLYIWVNVFNIHLMLNLFCIRMPV